MFDGICLHCECQFNSIQSRLNAEKNEACERQHVRQLKHEPREDVDSCLLHLRKRAWHFRYDVRVAKDAIRDELLEKFHSKELKAKLFETPNIQLNKALDTARVLRFVMKYIKVHHKPLLNIRLPISDQQ